MFIVVGGKLMAIFDDGFLVNSGTTAAVKCADVSEYCVETENEEVW